MQLCNERVADVLEMAGVDARVDVCSGIIGLACSDMRLSYSTNYSNRTTRRECEESNECDSY